MYLWSFSFLLSWQLASQPSKATNKKQIGDLAIRTRHWGIYHGCLASQCFIGLLGETQKEKTKQQCKLFQVSAVRTIGLKKPRLGE